MEEKIVIFIFINVINFNLNVIFLVKNKQIYLLVVFFCF